MPKESLQKKIGRVRPPRVHITYEVATAGAIGVSHLPFVVGVFVDLSGHPVAQQRAISQRRFAAIDRDNLDSVLRSIAPRLVLSVPNHLDGDGSQLHVELTFRSMNDFAPDRIAQQVAGMRHLLDLRTDLNNLRTMLLGNDRLEETIVDIASDCQSVNRAREELHELAKKPSAVVDRPENYPFTNRLIASARISGNAPNETFIRSLSVLFEEIAVGSIPFSDDVDRMIGERVKAIDELAGREMDEVLHAEPMQKLEASWRGLASLVEQSETSSELKIKVFNVSKTELLKDLRMAEQLEKAAIFERIRDESFGFTTELFGVFVGDFEFGSHLADIELIQKLSEVAAWWNAPFISAAAPAMLRFESFTELAGPRDLSKIFDDPTYASWHSLRKSDSARYIGLCLPRVLMRVPYGKEGNVVEEFDYRESAPNHAAYLWGNAAYSFAARLTDAFARYGWCAAIRGVEGGGLVEGLPIATFRTDQDDVVVKCPTEIAITDRRESELANLGFIPLCYYRGTDQAVFMGAASVQKPKLYMDDDANANARLSTQLSYIFAGSRFAHFMKALVKEKIVGFRSRSECEAFLNQWISQYVLLDDLASQESRAKFPLREARVHIEAGSGEPDVLRAVVFLRPHFQLDELAVSLRLVVPLPPLASIAST
jgi:type VI secretion system protein ImpC